MEGLIFETMWAEDRAADPEVRVFLNGEMVAWIVRESSEYNQRGKIRRLVDSYTVAFMKSDTERTFYVDRCGEGGTQLDYQLPARSVLAQAKGFLKAEILGVAGDWWQKKAHPNLLSISRSRSSKLSLTK